MEFTACLLAAGYPLLLVLFWRQLRARSRPEATQGVGRPAGASGGWFSVPKQVHLHLGHTWARVEPDGRVTVGLDDFAHKLVGRVVGIELPPPGEHVAQGEPAIRLAAGGKAVSLLSPVDGEVVAVNPQAARNLRETSDPYGSGWLFQVSPPRLAANLKQLLCGKAAQRWLEQASESLAARLPREAGLLLQDGGVPLLGIAQELEPENWDDLARGFFLSDFGG